MGKDNTNLLLYGGLAALGVFILTTSEKTSTTNIIPPDQDTPSTPSTPTTYSSTPTAPSSTPSTSKGLKPSEFVKKYLKAAMESQNRTGVPALVTLAQGGLESSWGKSAYGNNFFGIKAGSSWTGEIQKLKTWECGKTSDEVIQIFQPYSQGSNPSCNSKGKPSYRVYAKFRKYATAEQGFKDHANFLLQNKRYANAFKYKNSPTQFALEIAKAGYATAPNYGEVLIKTIINIKKLLS